MIGLLALLLVGGARPDSMASALRQALADAKHSMMRWGHIEDVRPSLAAVYAGNSWRPLWTVDGRPSAAGFGRVVKLSTTVVVGQREFRRVTAWGLSLTAIAMLAALWWRG